MVEIVRGYPLPSMIYIQDKKYYIYDMASAHPLVLRNNKADASNESSTGGKHNKKNSLFNMSKLIKWVLFTDLELVFLTRLLLLAN